jgi:type I restriction enzyme R subunit
MISEGSSFRFLQPDEPQLYRLGMLAEHYFSEDPNTCNIKLRPFSELVAQFTASRLGLPVAQSDNLSDLLRLLKIECNLPKQVLEILHSLRIAGNRAAHQNADDHSSALSGLKLAHQLAIWYSRTFHKPSGGFGPFIPPEKPKDVAESIVLELERLKAELEASLTEADQLRETARQAEIERQPLLHRSL